MRIDIQGIPEFKFDLSLEQIEVLITCSKSHYDSACRSASSDFTGTEIGFLLEWKRLIKQKIEFDWPGPCITAPFRYLDLCCKILENLSPVWDNKVELLTATKIKLAFASSLRLSNLNFDKWALFYKS